MSTQISILHTPVAPSTASGVQRTPGPKVNSFLSPHPLDPLSPDEVNYVSSLIRIPVPDEDMVLY